MYEMSVIQKMKGRPFALPEGIVWRPMTQPK